VRIFPHKVDWETADSLYCCCLSSETLIEMMDRFQVRFNHGCDCFRSYWTEKNKIDETHGLLGTAERRMSVPGTLSIFGRPSPWEWGADGNCVRVRPTDWMTLMAISVAFHLRRVPSISCDVSSYFHHCSNS
jgi:hypothetical protein